MRNSLQQAIDNLLTKWPYLPLFAPDRGNAQQGVPTVRTPAHSRLPTGPREVGQKISIIAVAIGGIVGAVSAALTSIFLLNPNLAQSTRNTASITQVAVEPSVTLEQYFGHLSFKSSIERTRKSYPEQTLKLLEQEAPRLKILGTVIH